jgi:ABC-type uncharacterized transport system fused permease/ATPase subunit
MNFLNYLVPSQSLDKLTSFKNFVEVVFTTTLGSVAGLALGGSQFALIGGGVALTVAIADSVMNSLYSDDANNDKHYFSLMSFWSFALYNPFKILGFSYPGDMLLPTTLGLSNLSDDFFAIFKKTEDNVNSYFLLKNLFNNEWGKYQGYYFIQVAIKISHLAIKVGFTAYYGTNLKKENFIYILEKIAKNKIQDGKINTYVAIFDVGLYSLVYTGFPLLFNKLIDMQSQKQTELILNLAKKLLNDEDNSRLFKSMGMQGQILESRLMENLFKAQKSSLELVNVIGQHVDFIINFYWSVNKASEFIAIKICWDLALQPTLNYLAEQSKDILSKYKLSYSKASEIMNNLKYNADAISIRDGNNFMDNTLNHYFKEFGKNDEERKIYLFYSNFVETFHGLVSNLIPPSLYLYFHYEKFVNTDPNIKTDPNIYNNLVVVTSSLNEISFFVFSNVNTYKNNIDFKVANSMLEEYLNVTMSRVVPTLNRTTNSMNKIIFNNYSISLENKTLLKIDHLELDKGRHYAILGDNGSGKTTLVTDIKSGLSGKMSSNGELSLPFQNHVIMLDQGVFLPAGLKLKDKLRFPLVYSNRLPESQRLQLEEFKTHLLEEFEVFDTNNLDQILEAEEVNLSGGQRKKIGIIQVILEAQYVFFTNFKSQVIIILDETFAEMSKESRLKIRFILSKYLERCTFLVIDHDAAENNIDQFYDAILLVKSYDFKMIHNSTDKINTNEIGIYLNQQGTLSMKITDQEPLALNHTVLSLDLFSKLSYYARNNYTEDGENARFFSLTKNDKRELKDLALTQNYIKKDSWIEMVDLRQQPYKIDELFKSSESSDDLCGYLNQNRENLVEHKPVYDLICGKYCDCNDIYLPNN